MGDWSGNHVDMHGKDGPKLNQLRTAHRAGRNYELDDLKRRIDDLEAELAAERTRTRTEAWKKRYYTQLELADRLHEMFPVLGKPRSGTTAKR